MLKPFNLEEYNAAEVKPKLWAGSFPKPVRLISTDGPALQPIVGVHCETIQTWSADGMYQIYNSSESSMNLMMEVPYVPRREAVQR